MPALDLSALTGAQNAVYFVLELHGQNGACRRTFAKFDIWEVSNRISEIEQRLGISIERDRCKRHQHRRPVTLYRL